MIDVLLEDDSLNGSLITDKPVEILGMCAECDSPDDDFMIACDKCNNWLHHKCVDLTEEKAREIYRYYCNNCYLKHDLQTQYDKLSTLDDKTSTPLPEMAPTSGVVRIAGLSGALAIGLYSYSSNLLRYFTQRL